MAGAKGPGSVWEERGRAEVRWCGSWRPLGGPGFSSEWEVALEGAEQRTDEVDLKRVNSKIGYCMESGL